LIVRVVVTGAAGFIGSSLCDALLAAGHDVVGIDNFSTGHRQFLECASTFSGFELRELDLAEGPDLAHILSGTDAVIHLAANADVRFGWSAPRRDLEQNVLVTHSLLEAARQASVPRFVFSSTGSVYGNTTTVPTPEDGPFAPQTSLYGASKLAAEAFIEAYAEGTGMTTTVFRFVSNMGPRYTHGHVFDFVRSLRAEPSRLTILGDGTQRKSYLDVTDCVDAIVSLLDRQGPHQVFNLGVDDYCNIASSASWICARLGLDPVFEYTGGRQGWIGDNPFIYLETSKIRATGWAPKFGIREAVERTVDYLVDNEWLFDEVDSTR
jgi:UDP-glucose 4-epimerase